MGLSNGVADLQVLALKRAVAVWGQLRLSQIFDTTALYDPVDEFGSVSPAAQLQFPSAIAIRFVRTLRSVSRTREDCNDWHGDLTLRHRFCATALMKMALRVIKGLAA